MAELLGRLPRLRWPWLVFALVIVLFLTLWGSALLGGDTLFGGDILVNIPPWWSGAPVQATRNPLLSDPVTQFVPWLTLVKAQWLHGQIPLWNPNAFGGSPLLANDQSAPFSLFTLAALPFTPARGYTLAMLLKMLVAGTGMAFFVKQLRVGAAGVIVAAVAYVGSAFMVGWLAYPQTAVAAIFPWAFACVEIWLSGRRRSALLGLAVAVAVQFLSGHAETSLHLGMLLVFYTVVRCLALADGRRRALGLMAGAAASGTALAGVQLVPFVANLSSSSLVSDRTASAFGSHHLNVSEILSWVIPNGRGNPGIDGLLGRAPNYLESTGYVGVAALLLSLVGLLCAWRSRRSLAIALGVPVVVAAGVVYGPLAGIAGRMPLLSSSNNERLLVVMCFALAALSGVGLQAIVDRPAARESAAARLAGRLLLGVGSLAVLGVAGLGVVLAVRGGAVDQLVGAVNGNIGFWVVVAALSVLGAACLLAASVLAVRRSAPAAGLACLVVVEAAMFAGPFQPRVPEAKVPPPSSTIDWLRAHVGEGSVAGQALDLIPNAASLYGLRDLRGYDVTVNPRVRLFWSRADPGYSDVTLHTLLSSPSAAWLAAAGVRYYVSAVAAAPAGTVAVLRSPTFTVSEVANARPFAFAASAVTSASNPERAVSLLASAPLGPVVVEQAGHWSAAAASVTVEHRAAGAVDLLVQATGDTTVVILQSYTADWTAKVDGRPAELRPADVLFQAVQVPAGRHQVVLRYAPASFTVGLLSSGAGLVIAVLWMLAPRLARRWSHADATAEPLTTASHLSVRSAGGRGGSPAG